jgi:hypothetical protein
MMVGKYAPPSVFITPFGGPNLFFEDTTVRGCPAPRHQVWRASVCATMKMFRSRFSGTSNRWLYGSSVPFHYMKHAPMVGVKQVFEQMSKEPLWKKAFEYSHR